MAATVAATPIGEAVSSQSGELFSAKEILVALLATYVAFFGWIVKQLADLRKALGDLRTELRGEIKELRTEVTSEMKELRSSIQTLTTELARMQGTSPQSRMQVFGRGYSGVSETGGRDFASRGDWEKSEWAAPRGNLEKAGDVSESIATIQRLINDLERNLTERLERLEQHQATRP